MVIWRRWGILAPVLAFIFALATQFSIDAMYGEGYYSSNLWTSALAMVLGGIAVGAFGSFLNSRARSAGESTHTLFFVPAECWGIVLVGGAVFQYFQP